MALDLYIEVQETNGTRIGAGPITSALSWRHTARMDKAGVFNFAMPLSDDKAALVTRKRIVVAYALVGGAWQEVGAGIIDRIERIPDNKGEIILNVSGDGLLRELAYRSVLNLTLYTNGLPVTHAQAVTAVGAYAPAGWTFTPDASPPSNAVYGYFNGETVLAGLIKVAEKSLTHFYKGAGRTVIFNDAFTPSGIRAIQADGDLAPETCAITSLAERIDTYNLLTRIYPRGSGNANVQLTLRATTRTAPAGFVLNKTGNYIESTAGVTQYGIIERQVDYRDVGPIANTSPDIRSAANVLFDVALDDLKRALRLEEASYTLTLAQCATVLRPLQSLRVVYRDAKTGMSIDKDLNILEATLEVTAAGVQTTGVVVTTSDKWVETETSAVVGALTQGKTYQALQQLSANSYVTAYTKNLDAKATVTFRFRFGKEVTQLQQVTFEFQLLPFTSTVRAVGTLNTTSSAGGSHTHSVTIAGHSHTVTIPAHSHQVTVPAHSHTVSIPNHSHSITTPNHAHFVTLLAHTHPIPNHTHSININASSGGVGFDVRTIDTGGIWNLLGDGVGSTRHVTTNASSGSTASNNNTESTLTSQGGGSSTHSSYDGGATTATTPTLTASVQSSSVQAQDVSSSSTTTSTQTTSTASGDHVHDVNPVINMLYGIFEDAASSIPLLELMQYRVNSGAWASLTGASSLTGGWYSLDVTAALIAADTFHPLQPENTIQVRCDPTTLSATISAWYGFASSVQVNHSAMTAMAAGDKVILTLLGDDDFYNVDATVQSITSSTTTICEAIPGTSGKIGDGGTIEQAKRTTIDAQLAVRNVIQAITYV